MLNLVSTAEMEEWRSVLVQVLDATVTVRVAAMRASVDNVLWQASVQFEASRKLLDGDRLGWAAARIGKFDRAVREQTAV
jgi:hypothetical protein